MSMEVVTVKVELIDVSTDDEENSGIQPEKSPKGFPMVSIPSEAEIPASNSDQIHDFRDENDQRSLVPDCGKLSNQLEIINVPPPDSSPKPEFVSIKEEIEDRECEPYQTPSRPPSPELSPEHPETSPSHHPAVSPSQTQTNGKIGEPIFISIKQETGENGNEEGYLIPVDPSYLVTNHDGAGDVSSSDIDESDIDTSKYIRNDDVRKIMSNIKDVFECVLCKMILSTKSNLQRHLMTHIKHKITCKDCKRQFLSKEMLKRHIKYNHEEKVFNCDECSMSFDFSVDLLRHKHTHVRYTCDRCEKTFSDNRLYEQHVARRKCKKVLHLTCPHCGKVFTREYLYQNHVAAHTRERPYHCNHCPMKFNDKSTLTRHLQLHNGIKPYACKVCGKRFTSSGLIKPHMRTHTGDRPFICTICDKAFSHKHNMQRHFAAHEKKKNKKLVCEVCLKVFPRESRLMYHMRVHQDDKRPFKCELCPKSFSNRQNITRHYKRKHPGYVYAALDTDASVARQLWQATLERKMSEAGEVIAPDECDGLDVKIEPEVKTELRFEDWVLKLDTNK